MSNTITSDQLEIVQDLNMKEFLIHGFDPHAQWTEVSTLDMNTNAILRAASGAAGTAGTFAGIQGGVGDNTVSGAALNCYGGKADGVTPGRIQAGINGDNGALGQVLVNKVVDPDYGPVMEFGSLGDIKLEAHAAPADGDLAAGELRLWFDQTDGAAKLMIKAKQADGTVRTAAVNLA